MFRCLRTYEFYLLIKTGLFEDKPPLGLRWVQDNSLWVLSHYKTNIALKVDIIDGQTHPVHM